MAPLTDGGVVGVVVAVDIAVVIDRRRRRDWFSSFIDGVHFGCFSCGRFLAGCALSWPSIGGFRWLLSWHLVVSVLGGCVSFSSSSLSFRFLARPLSSLPVVVVVVVVVVPSLASSSSSSSLLAGGGGGGGSRQTYVFVLVRQEAGLRKGSWVTKQLVRLGEDGSVVV